MKNLSQATIFLATLVWLAGGTARAQNPSAGTEAVAGPLVGGTEGVAGPLTPEQRLEELEQRQRIIERRQELDAESAATRAKTAPVVSAGREGFSLSAADGSSRVRFRGLIQVDGRYYIDDQPSSYQNILLVRRGRPILEGTLGKYYHFRFMPDFGEGKAVVQDLYLDAWFLPEFGVMAGKFKEPVGLERLQGIADTTFVEFSLPTSLTPNRDVGVMVHGDLLEGRIAYAAGVFNGVPDGATADRNVDGRFDYAGRLFFLPFKGGDLESLRGLGFGVGGSSGLHYGLAGSPEVGSYKSAGQTTWFRYRSDGKTLANTVVADGQLDRWSPQFYYFYGPFGLTGEYVSSGQRVRLDDETATLTHTAWQVTASLVLTGEDVTYKGVKPRKPFDPKAKSWGAWELAGRYSELTVDDDAFPVFADPAASAEGARSWGAGANIYLSGNIKVMVDYDETWFVGDKGGRVLPTERVYFSRFQVSF